jgi:uncharacterized protein
MIHLPCRDAPWQGPDREEVPVPSEIPPGIAIEPVFLVEATYAPDAAETRPLHRAEHLARVMVLRAAGTILEAGGCTDLSAAYLLFRAVDAEAVAALINDDVYLREGVWASFRVRGFGRVCRPEELVAGG